MEKLEYRMGKDGSLYKNSIYLYNALEKHGAENFEYTLLEEIKQESEDDNTQEIANEFESYYINALNSKEPNIGYNIKDDGFVGKHSEETKRKQSENNSRYWEGKTLSEEHCIRISEGKKAAGVVMTEEQKQFKREFMINLHKIRPHPMLGKHHTPKARVQISASTKGIKKSPASVAAGAQTRTKTERNELLLKDYVEGILTVKAIMEKYETNGSTVSRIVKKAGVPMRSPQTSIGKMGKTPLKQSNK